MVDIVVRAKNNHALTSGCLTSIRRNTPAHSYRLILSDDGSDPPIGDVMTDIYIRSRFSHGGVTATNLGIGASLNLFDNPFALILDNDVTIPDGDRAWLLRMVETLEASGPKTACVSVSSKETRPDLWFTSHAVLFRKSVLSTLGAFDERFNPGQWDDKDYAVRMRVSGFDLAVAGSVSIGHIGSQTFAEAKAEHFAANEAKFRSKWTEVEIGWLPEGITCPP